MFGFKKRKKRFSLDRETGVSVFKAILNNLCDGNGAVDTFDVQMMDEDGLTASVLINPNTRHGVVTISPGLMKRPDEDVWTALAHELGHVYEEDNSKGGHGPGWFAWMINRGITVDTVTVDGVEKQTEPHKIIRGGRLDRLRNAWMEENNVEPDHEISAAYESRMIDLRDVKITRYAPPVDYRKSPSAMAYIAKHRGAPMSNSSTSQSHGHATHLDQNGDVSAPVTDLTDLLICCDASGSMDCALSGSNLSRLGVAKDLLTGMWPSENRPQLLTFSQWVTSYNSPYELPSMAESGTLFGVLFDAIATSGARRVLLISDGDLVDSETYTSQEQRESVGSVMAARAAAISSGVEMISAIFIGEQHDHGFEFMRRLCYGGGACVAALEPNAMERAMNIAVKGVPVSGGKSNVPAVHRMPDLAAQTQSVARQAAGAAVMAGRVVDLGNRISQAEHDIHEVGQRLKIAIAGNDVVSGIHEQAGQVFQAQDERDAQDAANRAAASAQLDSGLQRFGANVLGQTQAAFAGQIDGDNARAVDRGQLVHVTQIKGVGMEFGRQPIVNKAGAMLSSQPQAAGLLPPPPGLGRSAPRPAQSAPALPRPSEQPIAAPQMAEPRRGRVLTPVKRGS